MWQMLDETVLKLKELISKIGKNYNFYVKDLAAKLQNKKYEFELIGVFMSQATIFQS